jgi:hypothetical protein
MNKLNYCLIGDPVAAESIKNSDDLVLSGLWQWSIAFDRNGSGGDVQLIRRKEELEEFDIIHVNMTGGNFALLHMIRDELGDSSDTKIVTNIDFDVGNWGRNFIYPTILEKALRCADMVFHVESRGASVLEHVLDESIPVLPHPVDVNGIDSYKRADRDPMIGIIHHRYYPDPTTPYWATRDLPLNLVLMGYTKGNVPTLSMYDQTIAHTTFKAMIENMSKAKFGLDLFHGYNYGRTVIEFAALAVPCVCSDTIDAGHRLFPDLVVNPFDVKKVHKLFDDLIKNDDEYVEVFTQAYEKASFYSHKNCYNRFINALEETTT